MNATELADELENTYPFVGVMEIAATMLRQQQAEIEALKMGFANSGTHDSELAETRAMAGRLFLKVQDLEFEQEGYENLTEMLESEKAKLTEKNCQQQAEIETLKALLVKEQDESFDRTASHMAGEYVSHPVKELKNIVLASATCSCGKVMEVTNLQPVKDLTDEEITEIAKDCGYANAYHYNIRFAKAILKKAQK